MDTLTIRKPDDWHLHFRDGFMLQETVPATSRCFSRAIVMPNLIPPVTTGSLAESYRQRIEAAIPKGSAFTPLMTIYLTDDTSPAIIADASKAGVVAAKLYPAGATTNSASAVHNLDQMQPVFEAMAHHGMLLLIHGEVTDPDIDIFDREKVFIERRLIGIVERNPSLKIVLEHITTAEAAQFVLGASDRVAATVTPQHLLYNRNDLLVGGIRPHNYCLPVLKRNTHQLALREAVAKGTPKIFLGTDSAPHERGKKESACGCAGCYSAWSALELYAQIFEDLGALDYLEGFASEHGPRFYGLELNQEKVKLVRESWHVPTEITLPDQNKIVPFYAGMEVRWKVQEV
ncbi:MAG: dihydroorotase [Zetaproteobacteria bacterium]|nr:dihydroorotase [Pseudobdellovibrionaceae bacterium]